MTVVTIGHSSSPAPAPAFALERIAAQIGVPYDNRFSACRALVALIEAAAQDLSETDRTQLARLMSATAHAILCSTSKRV